MQVVINKGFWVSSQTCVRGHTSCLKQPLLLVMKVSQAEIQQYTMNYVYRNRAGYTAEAGLKKRLALYQKLEFSIFAYIPYHSSRMKYRFKIENFNLCSTVDYCVLALEAGEGGSGDGGKGSVGDNIDYW